MDELSNARSKSQRARAVPLRFLMQVAAAFCCSFLLLVSASASAEQPAGIADLNADPLVDDPGFSRWFSGVARAEKDGQLVFSVHAGVDGAGESLGHDSMFWLGSNAKMLVSAMLLQRVDEGALSLDDPVSAHIEELSDGDLSLEGVPCTVRLLLAHQCGIPRDPPTDRYAGLLDPFGDPSRRPAFLEWLRETPLNGVPGAEYAYSNVGYTLAGLLLVEAEGEPLDAVFQRRLAGPLGLTRTGFDPARLDAFEEHAAPLTFNMGGLGLSVSRWFRIPETSPALLGSAGGAFSTPAEYARLMRALFRGDLLSEASRETLVTPVLPGEEDREDLYALGVGVERHEDHTRLRHQGALIPHGFSTHMLYIPEWDFLLITMSSRP